MKFLAVWSHFYSKEDYDSCSQINHQGNILTHLLTRFKPARECLGCPLPKGWLA